MREIREKILIVDDERINITVLVDLLRVDYDIVVAKNGEHALRRARSETGPDLILLDIMMPGMDGYEVCRQLKAGKETAHIPVIFITAMEADSEETRGLDLGAVDYITKPISPPIVRARVRAHLALHRVRRELAEKNQALSLERVFIEDIIVKMRRSEQFDGRSLRFLNTPVERTTGDVLLSARRPDGGQHVLVGDFTGHGLSAAIGGPMVSDIFYAMTGKGLPMAAIQAEVNRKLNINMPTGMFMAAVFLSLDPERRHLSVWNCSSPEVLVYRGPALQERIPSAFLARGILVRDADEPGQWLELQPGDRVFAASDGIEETKSSRGEAFGSSALENLLARIIREEDSLEVVRQVLEQFRGGGVQPDDITLVEMVA